MPSTYVLLAILICLTYQWTKIHASSLSDFEDSENLDRDFEDNFPGENYRNWLKTKLMVAILKNLPDSRSDMDDADRSVELRKRQRQCYWSVVTCY